MFSKFVKSAVYYDEIPDKMGYIWENMPPVDVVNKLAPKGNMQNLKGKRSVLAYRDNQDDPFHYVFFSYDARGRVEAIVRWTENIGFEIVKYTYNSMNKVHFVNVIDAVRQYSTWNVYDDNGKLWKVYSKMGDAGSGYNYQNKNYEDISLPVPMTRPLSPDITYSYTKRNEVDSIIYNSAGANKQIFYDPMGWVDSLIVNRSGQQVFRQILERDDMGMVIQQKSKHPSVDEKTINYTYDNLNRLTAWQNPVNNNSQTFAYDDIGNRTGSTDNGLSLSYSYNTGTNQLSQVNKYADTTFNFSYNSYGAVTSVFKKYQANTIKQETWEYVNSTVPKIYSKTVGADVWTWRYRRGAFDTREQKRLVVSPFGDGGEEGDPYAQSWEYSLTGVAGEELVLYKGIQTTKSTLVWPLDNGKTDQGRRVYMAMSRFFVAGTELQYQPSGNKELHIRDNQGNVRTIFDQISQIRSFDYKPFGEIEWTSTDKDRDRKGFAGSEYDSESDYYALGYRMYSAEFGRFLAVDPLFEAMPRHNPYHYSYNSPMFWSDPSGLVPVKEKNKNSEQLQALQFNWQTIRDFKIRQDEEIERFSAFEQYMEKVQKYADWYLNLLHQANFGATSSGSAGAGYNGADQTMELNVPVNWDTKSLDKSTAPANKHLRELQKTTKNEVGYLLRYDKNSNKLYADFFIGKDGDTWLNLNNNPYDSPLKDSEMIVGFIHSHPGKESSGFSYQDLTAIGYLSLGKYKWTNVPSPALFDLSNGKVSKILNKKSEIYDRMYFGVIHSKGKAYDSFSWKLTDSKFLNGMYNNIWLLGGIDNYTNFIKDPKSFGAEYLKKRR